MKRTFFILTLLFLIVGCANPAGRQMVVEESTAVTDDTTTPTPRPTTPPVTGTVVLADGQLVAQTPALPLAFKASGQLLEILVTPGDAVHAGDLIARLDDKALQEAVTNAELQVKQAEISLAQAQLTLDDLLNWEPDETAVALAQANVAAAQAALENAQAADAAAGNSLTSARVNLEQAQRSLEDAQKAYDTAFDPGRDWELGDPWRKPALEAERDAATRNLTFAQENLEVARAQYNLALAGLNNDTAVSAQANLLSAQQALEQATTGPKQKDITAAELQVQQAELTLEQAQVALEQAQATLADAQLAAPWDGVILSVEAAPGATVSAGTPIVTLLDNNALQFQTSNFSERDLSAVTPGQPVEITLKAYPSQPITGTVARIAPQASGTLGDAATFTIIINLDETTLPLRAGMTGRVEILPDEGG